MTFEEKRQEIANSNPDALLADGFEDALIGKVQIFSRVVACYDRGTCLRILEERDRMTPEEAEEFFEFNVVGGFFGENTPAFLTILEQEETEEE